MDSRHYENKLPSPMSSDVHEIVNASGKLAPNIRSEIENIYRRLLSEISIQMEEISKSRDGSVYTGTAGYAYLYLTLHEKEANVDHLLTGSHLAEKSLKSLKKRDVTFLCGDLGPLCVAAVLRHRMNQTDAAAECVSAVLDFVPIVLNLQNDIPNELLYGRVGYLYGLLFLQHFIPGSIDVALFKQVAGAVISAGTREGRPPLMWNWHNKKYLGGAHGVAGILYLLLQVKEHLTREQLDMIRGTVDYLISIRFPSGNLPSSVGSSDDRLVHWCHGAPGFVQLLLAATQVWKDKRYLTAAEQCGEVVWRRGLLRKGYGICHGVAGNAYTFIALYQATGHLSQLHRAVEFARWCGTYDQKQERPPDRPYSLFEGLAGTLYFLKDIQTPSEAIFPAYSIRPFEQLSALIL